MGCSNSSAISTNEPRMISKKNSLAHFSTIKNDNDNDSLKHEEQNESVEEVFKFRFLYSKITIFH